MLNFLDHASDLRGIFSGNGLLHPGKAQAHQGGTNLLRAANAALYLGKCNCITHNSTKADQDRIKNSIFVKKCNENSCINVATVMPPSLQRSSRAVWQFLLQNEVSSVRQLLPWPGCEDYLIPDILSGYSLLLQPREPHERHLRQ